MVPPEVSEKKQDPRYVTFVTERLLGAQVCIYFIGLLARLPTFVEICDILCAAHGKQSALTNGRLQFSPREASSAGALREAAMR